jgi:hypothetical protein
MARLVKVVILKYLGPPLAFKEIELPDITP